MLLDLRPEWVPKGRGDVSIETRLQDIPIEDLLFHGHISTTATKTLTKLFLACYQHCHKACFVLTGQHLIST